MTDKEMIRLLQHQLDTEKHANKGHAERMACFGDVVTRLDEARCQTIANLLQEKRDMSAEWVSLEKQYSERLERMAQLCSIVIPWLQSAMGGVPDADIPAEVREGITEIMDYVDAVRPIGGGFMSTTHDEGIEDGSYCHRYPSAASAGSPLMLDMVALFRAMFARYADREDMFTGHARDMKALLSRYDSGER